MYVLRGPRIANLGHLRSSIPSCALYGLKQLGADQRCKHLSTSQPLPSEIQITAASTMSKDSKKPKETPIARPSASVILVSPTNQILLLHRVRTSSAFPSAHVFPGGNISDFHDGSVPAEGDKLRHIDSEAYRLAAIRETFEESGILLARNNGFGRLIEVPDADREEGRKLIHAEKVDFRKWLAAKGGRADLDGLIPFTRWITPVGVPKRFTTQMYLYFLPLAPTDPYRAAGEADPLGSSAPSMIPVPTHDGGLEHTAAQFLPAREWMRMAQAGEIILFPPQFFLLHLISQHLDVGESEAATSELAKRRSALKEFVKTGEPAWGDKCISPTRFMSRKEDGRQVLGLDKPGPELRGSDRKGEFDRVVLVDFRKEGPRKVDVRWRKDVLEEERQSKI